MGLVDDVLEHVTDEVAGLQGENDLMPFLAYRGRDDKSVIAMLDMPEQMEQRDGMADIVAALLAVHQATEAIFCSCAWAVLADTGMELPPQVKPSEHPARKEIVFLTHIRLGEKDAMHHAYVTRECNKVALSNWEVTEGDTISGGRFGDAMHMGMRLGQDMPPEWVAYIKACEEEGDFMAAVRPVASSFAKLRQMYQ